MNVPRLILVGRVAGAFGVRGEVRITAFGDDPLALLRYRALSTKDGAPALTLEAGRLHKGGLVARAPEIASKEAADAMHGVDLYVPREALPEPEDEDDFYLADLIGLAVRHVDGRDLGRVAAVQNFGAGDLIEVEPPEGARYYLPFTRAAVPEVRIDEGVLIVEPPNEVSGEEVSGEEE